MSRLTERRFQYSTWNEKSCPAKSWARERTLTWPSTIPTTMRVLVLHFSPQVHICVEYKDDNYMVPRSSSVIVRRLPASAPGKGSAQRYLVSSVAAPTGGTQDLDSKVKGRGGTLVQGTALGTAAKRYTLLLTLSWAFFLAAMYSDIQRYTAMEKKNIIFYSIYLTCAHIFFFPPRWRRLMCLWA